MPKRKPDPEKMTSLEAAGSLNKKHHEVRDALFQDSDFFDPRDVVQVKYEMLRRVNQDQWPVTKASDLFGFSRFAYYETEANFKAQGMMGLLPKKKGPQRSHKLTDEVLVFLSDLEAERSYSAEELADRVQARFAIEVHPRSIGRALARWKKKR